MTNKKEESTTASAKISVRDNYVRLPPTPLTSPRADSLLALQAMLQCEQTQKQTPVFLKEAHLCPHCRECNYPQGTVPEYPSCTPLSGAPLQQPPLLLKAPGMSSRLRTCRAVHQFVPGVPCVSPLEHGRPISLHGLFSSQQSWGVFSVPRHLI